MLGKQRKKPCASCEMLFLLLAASLVGTAVGVSNSTERWVGGYALLNGAEGLSKLNALSSHAATLPLTRIFLGFFSPTLVYIPGSNNLSNCGLSLSSVPDGGFAALKQAIGTLTASGIKVLLSMGGWDFNCFPYGASKQPAPFFAYPYPLPGRPPPHHYYTHNARPVVPRSVYALLRCGVWDVHSQLLEDPAVLRWGR